MLIQIILVFGVMAFLSSSRSTFQSLAETLEVEALAGGRMGTKTGVPPLKLTWAMYWSKTGGRGIVGQQAGGHGEGQDRNEQGSKRMTSSPG